MISDLIEKMRGIIPPVTTPLSEDGKFDPASAEKLYGEMMAAGSHGLFLFGSSGEGPVLSEEVKTEVVKIAQSVTQGKVPVFAGIMAPGTEQVIKEAKWAEKLNVDAVVVCPPYYYPVTQSEVLNHFRLVKQATDLPIMAYDIPVTTKIKINYETMLTIANEGLAIGAKDSSGDSVGFSRLINNRPDNFKLFTGTEALVDAIMLKGADGTVPGLANVAPELFVQLYDKWKAGEMIEALLIQKNILELYEVIFLPDGSFNFGYALGSMKTAQMLRGWITSNKLTQPFDSVSPDRVERIRKIMIEIGIL